MPLRPQADILEELYGRLNRRQYVQPDPLQVLYDYDRPDDREMVALVASALAYGRVKQILASINDALGRLGPSPGAFVASAGPEKLRAVLAGFRHRFSDGANLAALLAGAAAAVRKHGSLQRCFVAGMDRRDETLMAAVGAFAAALRQGAPGDCGHLLSDPSRGSACKRLHLMLRWLSRRDEVDPGGWHDVPPDKLVVPMDTHMHRMALRLGATGRRAADGKAALETTAAFRALRPDDPVRYDFALTRLGIRAEMDVDEFLARCRKNVEGFPHA